MALIRSALAGTPDGAVKNAAEGRYASVARPIWGQDRDRQPLGAVYVQSPAGGLPDGNLLAQVGAFLVPSSLFWLCLMLPIGLIFGTLTTRGMIRRIERLVDATARFTEGHFSQRVLVSKTDEIGQLEQQFNGMAEQLVDSFAQRQALAEQSARREERARIEQEMSSAHYVQQSLLPKEIPSIKGWQIEPFYQPAREVGGDLYDFLSLPDGRIGIAIGDVSGKGMPAALIMATTCAMIRAAAPCAASPGEVLALVNNLLQIDTSPRIFATCFSGILDPAGSLRFANAGHDIPYLCRAGEIVELRATGMPLGLMPEQSYLEQEVFIDKNDAILFYTDGLVEAHNTEREMFSFPRLQRLMKDHHTRADDLIEFLLNELQGFTGPVWEQEDDITLVMLRKIT